MKMIMFSIVASSCNFLWWFHSVVLWDAWSDVCSSMSVCVRVCVRRVVDGTWHMPMWKRDAKAEHQR